MSEAPKPINSWVEKDHAVIDEHTIIGISARFDDKESRVHVGVCTSPEIESLLKNDDHFRAIIKGAFERWLNRVCGAN